jgi:glutathionylspermidine synthase
MMAKKFPLEAGTPTDRFVYQAYHALPDFSGNRPVIGSWVVNHEAHGLGIRESNTEITDDFSRFIPHIIRDRAQGSSFEEECRIS